MKTFLMIGLVCLPLLVFAQDSSSKKKSWSFSGYLKDLVWIRFDQGFRNANATNLVHNRLNTGWKPNAHWNSRLEVRNRWYLGDDVSSVKQQLRHENEMVNLSVQWMSSRSSILHTNVERLWLEYKKPKWNIRSGRQRVNWGITNTWNPNDIFNSYSFLDFDYEERPGSVAVKFQYLTKGLSHMELAVAGTRHQPIMATRFFTNYRNYDLQWIAGMYQNTFTAGFGWAGSLKDVGFKGEVQFHASQEDNLSQLLLVLEGDYIFKNGWYLSSAFLYNQKGLTRPLNDWEPLHFTVSARSLMPTKWNLLVNTSKQFTPLFSGSMNLVYAPGVNLFIFFPTLQFNLQTNLDFDFIWQSFFAETSQFKALSHSGFARLRWSF